MPTLNVRLAAILLVCLAVVGGGVHLLHGYQIGRQSQALKRASERAEENHKADLAKAAAATKAEEKAADRTDAAKNLVDAIRLLRDYASLNRRDVGAELHLATLYVEAGQLRGAFDAFEDGLRHVDDAQPPLTAEEISAVRWKLVKEVAIRIGRLPDAQEHLDVLLDGAVEKNLRHRRNHEKPEGDPEQLELYGQILLFNLKYQEACGVFEDVIAIDPGRVDAYSGLAGARFHLNQKPEAEAAMESMLAKSPKSTEAYEKYVAYYHQQAAKATDETERDRYLKTALTKARQALEKSPDEARFMLLVGRCYAQQQEYDKAEEYTLKGITATKNDDKLSFYYSFLVDVQNHLRKKDLGKTLEKAAEATRGTPGGPDLLWQLADYQIRAGKFKEAETMIKDLKAENYPPGKISYLESSIAFQEQNWAAAKKILEEEVIPIKRTGDWPTLRIQAQLNLVQCYRQLGRGVNEQIRLLEEINQSNSHIYQAHALLADIYTAQRKLDLATEQRRLAANCLPANSPQQEDVALQYLQNLVAAQLRTEERKRNWSAIEKQLESWTANKAPRPEYEVLKAEVALGQGNPDKARELLETCTKQKPNSAAAWLALARLTAHRADGVDDPAKKGDYWKAAANYIDQAEKAIGNGVIVRSCAENWRWPTKTRCRAATRKSAKR